LKPSTFAADTARKTGTSRRTVEAQLELTAVLTTV